MSSLFSIFGLFGFTSAADIHGGSTSIHDAKAVEAEDEVFWYWELTSSLPSDQVSG